MNVPNPVVIVPYDPGWPRQYESARNALEEALGDALVAIEHVGSTAVPGLAAKPIVDIMIAVRSLDAARRRIPALEGLGYTYVPEYEEFMPERLYLRTGRPASEHLHIVEPDGEFWERHLLFRDYLRRHPEVAREYAGLKEALAERFRDDRNAYTDAKTEFITSVVARARQASR